MRHCFELLLYRVRRTGNVMEACGVDWGETATEASRVDIASESNQGLVMLTRAREPGLIWSPSQGQPF
jgi:hypothetical protein